MDRWKTSLIAMHRHWHTGVFEFFDPQGSKIRGSHIAYVGPWVERANPKKFGENPFRGSGVIEVTDRQTDKQAELWPRNGLLCNIRLSWKFK